MPIPEDLVDIVLCHCHWSFYPLGPTLGTDSASCPRPGPVPTNAPSLSKLDTKLNRDEVRVDYPIRPLARPEKRDKNATFTQPGSDVAQTNL